MSQCPPGWKRVHERKSNELRRTVAQCLDGQVPIVRQAWCPQVATNLEKLPGLAAPLTRTLEETLGACTVVRDRAQIGGAKPTFYGTVGDDGALLLCTARRAPACDLGALQNLSGPPARKQVPSWMALRGQSSKNPLWSFTYPTFCRFSRKRQQI